MQQEECCLYGLCNVYMLQLNERKDRTWLEEFSAESEQKLKTQAMY